MKAIFLAAFFSILLLTTYAQPGSTGPTNNYEPFTLGRIYTIHSKVLEEERVLNVYLPAGYDAKDTIRYPVIYLLDGSAEEDFIHIAGLVQFSSFDWVGYLPKSIVVGIANVDRRRDFTTPSIVAAERKAYPTTGHADRFVSFIASELQPFIEKELMTTTSRTIIGESLGGLLAANILLHHPEMFDNYIIVSPSIWWSNGSLLNERMQLPSSSQSKKVYVAAGKEGLTPGASGRLMEADAAMLVDQLRSQNIDLRVYFDYLPGEDHGTILHQAVLNAFRQWKK